jgi:hypothetical protein
MPDALAAARQIGDARHRAQALTGLARQLVSLPLSSLVGLWSESLHHLSTRERSDFLSDLAALSPVVIAQVGQQGADELASAIVDVGRWWP